MNWLKNIADEAINWVEKGTTLLEEGASLIPKAIGYLQEVSILIPKAVIAINHWVAVIRALLNVPKEA